MKKIYNEYKSYYLINYNWVVKETYKEWLRRLKDIDSPLLKIGVKK